MSSHNAAVAARRHFDQAMAALGADTASALNLFRAATEIDPSMADAWLGRIAAGDEDLMTMARV